VSSLATLSRNISWNYIDAAVALIVYLVLTPVIVNYLGVTGFGIWVLINAILYYLQFLDLGFYGALVKYIAEFGERGDWPRVNGLIQTTISVLILAGVVALSLSAVVAVWIVPSFFNVPPDRVAEFQLAVLLIGFQLLVGFPGSVLSAIYHGCQRFDVLSGFSVLSRVVIAIGTLSVLHLGYGVVGLVAVQILWRLVHAGIFVMLLPRLVPEARLGLGPVWGEHYRQIRAYSGWSSLNELIDEGGSQLETLLIPLLLSVSLVTPYTLVCAVAAGIFLAIEPITETFLPMSSVYDARDDKPQLRSLLLRGSKLVMAISLPLAVAVTAYGEPFIHLWIGEETVEIPSGVMPLVVASFTTTAFVMTGAIILLAMARVRELFWMSVSEMILVLVLVLNLVPRTGLPGLAGSLFIANFAMTFLVTVPFVCKQLNQSMVAYVWISLLRPLLAAVPAFVAVLLLDRVLDSVSILALIIKSAVVGLSFLAVFWGVSVSSEERELVLSSARELWRRWRPA